MDFDSNCHDRSFEDNVDFDKENTITKQEDKNLYLLGDQDENGVEH